MARRLRSSSEDGQSLKSRADESKGSRKKELDKLSRVDKKNFANAPAYVQDMIRRDYWEEKHRKTMAKNKGKYI